MPSKAFRAIMAGLQGARAFIKGDRSRGRLVQRPVDSSKEEVRAQVGAFDEIRKRLFPEGPPPPVTVEQMGEAIGDYIRAKHPRRR